MHKYRLVAKKGEGTFSEVLKAQCIKNGKYVAIKCMKNHFDSLDQVNNLREIQALRRLSPHPHIIKLQEVLYDQPTGRLALVFELMDMNIYELIRGRRHYVAEDRVKAYLYQLMKSMDHMHRNGIFHRDIKPENILIMDDCLKLADFGSCRGIYSKQPYTEYISTRWYRAPECLLTDGYYNYKMDMWGVGCVMFEVVALYPLFPGNNELDQIQKIHAIMGTPPPDLLAKLKKRSNHAANFDFLSCEGTGLAKMLAHVSSDCADLIAKLLAYNPDERLSARQALRHPYFKDLREQEKRTKAAMQPDIAGSYLALDSDRGHQAAMSQALSSEALMPAGSGVSDQLDGVHGAALSFLGAVRVSNGGLPPAAAASGAAADHTAGGPAGAGAGSKGLPAISSVPIKVHGYSVGGPLQQTVTHVPLHHLQQQPGHVTQPHQQQSHSLQQAPLDKFDGLHITGSGSLRERDGSLGLLAESSTATVAVHIPTLALNPQASMDSIWEEPSEKLLGGPTAAGGGQLLPPLMSKASSNSLAGSGVQGIGQGAARRSSYLGQQANRNQHQQQHLQQAAGTYKTGVASGKQHHSHGGLPAQTLAAKTNVLPTGQGSTARFSKQGIGSNSSSSLQPPGSLASSMTNVSRMQATGGANKYNRVVGGNSSAAPGVPVAGSKKPVGSYVSPYGQRR